ncbi:MAG TPA: apolipoprotein N-acyltransferase [Acidimicrobiales bacterium]
MAVSLPPWGWWPLAFIGIAILDRLVADRPARSRFARTWLFGVAWLAPGMGWMWFLTAPGYVVAVASYAGYLGLAAAIAPGGRWRRLALPAALTVAEAIRLTFPFGGVPLASIGISQAYSPLSETARLGGVLLITWLTFMAGSALAAAWERSWRQAVLLAITPLALIAFGVVAPAGRDTGRSLTIAIVQGGGPQGTRAADTDPRVVFERHLAATQLIDQPVDLVVWPENVIDVDGVPFADSQEREEVAAEATRLNAPFAVGITEDAGERFTNAQVVVTPEGRVTSRYDKVRRVPFGEYMPLRGLLKALGAPTDQVPHDALPGTGPAVLDLPSGDRLAVMISWEVFFGGRARDGVVNGGGLLLNPTNGSSYTGTILQTQQVASSRLRALENGRSVVQVAPTGFSAFVTPEGDVLDRTGISEQAVRIHTVALRDGRTIYSRLGEKTIAIAALVVCLLGVVLARRDRRRRSAATPPPAAA